MALGTLERVVMDRLWSWGRPATVREVRDDLAEERDLAYTTVMTVMDNLHRKGELTRERHGRAYLYLPARSREDWSAGLMGAALSEAGDRSGALLRFVEELTPADRAELRRLVDEDGDPRDAS